MKNRLKEILRAGQVAIGGAITSSNLDAAEIMARMGFDWLVFDTEHAPLSIGTVQALMQAAKGTEIVPIVRVAWNDMVLIKLALDIGAYGIIIPWVNNQAEAVRAVRACKYPPAGIRGVGPRRAAEYGTRTQEYMRTADEEVMVIPQIETEEAVNNAEEILSVKGMDAFIVGPADLSTSLGVPLQFDHPKFVKAIKKVLQAGKKAKIPAGMFAPGAEAAARFISQGFQLVCVGGDIGFLMNGCRAALEKVAPLRTKTIV